jgi:NADH dehydrogenase
MKQTKVVIIGGGFGGIKAAIELSKQSFLDVTLISDKDHFIYYPSLYSVATGGSRRQSFVPLTTILRGNQVRIVIDTVEGYDPERKIIRGANSEYSYDKAIFALGVVTSYFGIKGLDKYSFGIKSSEEVNHFRKHIHDEMVSEHKIDKQYVVVGAGPTGVELSAALASHIAHIASAHNIRHNRIRIKLVEAAPRVLPRMSEDASRLVQIRLKSLGVEVMTDEKVEWQDDDEVFVSGRSIPTHTVVWTSGVSNNPFFEQHNHLFSLAPNKKVIVNEHMKVNENTYVIGDNAMTPYSGLAQTALHDAIYVSKDIVRTHKKHARPSYKAVKPPVVIPVGKRWAVLEWNFILIVDYIGHLIRRAADFVGYNDMLPLGLAFATWQSEEERDYNCDTCREHKV